METADETAITLRKLYGKLELIDREFEEINQRREAVLLVIREFESEKTETIRPKLPDFLVRVDEGPEYDVEIKGLDIDLSEGKNLEEKFFLVCVGATILGKVISVGEVAQYLIDRGASKAKLRHAKSAVSTLIGGHDGYFEKIEPGIYRYYPEGKPDVVTEGVGGEGDDVSMLSSLSSAASAPGPWPVDGPGP